MIEDWRKSMDIDKFILVGHSWGCYIGGTYAAEYPQHISKALLLSPFGVKVKPEKSELRHMRFNGRKPSGIFSMILKGMWGFQTPFTMLQKLPESQARKRIARYSNYFLSEEDREGEREALCRYMY